MTMFCYVMTRRYYYQLNNIIYLWKVLLLLLPLPLPLPLLWFLLLVLQIYSLPEEWALKPLISWSAYIMVVWFVNYYCLIDWYKFSERHDASIFSVQVTHREDGDIIFFRNFGLRVQYHRDSTQGIVSKYRAYTKEWCGFYNVDY